MARFMDDRDRRVANQRREKTERNMRILQMFRDGARPPEIARVFEVTPQRIKYIIKRELKEIGAARREMAEELFDLELERLTAIIRQAWLIANSPCRECQGQGVFRNGEVCIQCDGEGKNHQPDVRLKAMKEVRNAIDQRTRMLGNYAPEKFALTDTKGRDRDLGKIVEDMSLEELEKTLGDYDRGIQAGMEIAKEREKNLAEDLPPSDEATP